MRKLSIGATAIAALAFGAENAASEGLLERSPAPTYHAGCSSFHGFFIGANAGGAHLRADQYDADGYRVASATQGVVVNAPVAFSATDRAFIGGGQIGFNLQRGCTVFGLEADWSRTNLKAHTELFPNALLNGGTAIVNNFKTSIDSIGTIRTRSGIVVDNTLLYITGGLAWSDVHNSRNFARTTGLSEQSSWGNTRWGWAAGVGVEHAFTDRISIKSEVLYMNFGEHKSPNFQPIARNTATFGFKTDEDVVVSRVGLNIRFNRPEPIAEPIK